MCLFVLYSVSTFVGYLKSNDTFLYKLTILFQTIPFHISTQAIQFNQTVLIQTIQFSIYIVFVYTQLNVKTVIFQIIQFSIQKQFYCKQFSLA